MTYGDKLENLRIKKVHVILSPTFLTIEKEIPLKKF